MSKDAEESMNSLTIYEARVLHAQCGFVTIMGNGQVTTVCYENEAEDAERLRCMNGY